MPLENLSLRLVVMGRPVVIRSDGAGLLSAAAGPYADGVSGAADGPPIELRLASGGEALAGPLAIRVEGARLRLTGAGFDGWADARTLTAFCEAPLAHLGAPGGLIADAVETLLLFLLARSGRTPLHAAGVVRNGTAVVLAGPSGSGKSTLSLAAMRRGWQVLSDDTVYIQLQPCLRIWGLPRAVHVFPVDAPGFTGGSRLRGGKLKAAVPIPPGLEARAAERAAVVVLERGEAVRMEPISPSEAAAALSRLEPGFDLLRRESAAAIAALTASGAWRLTLSGDPRQALHLLAERFG